MYFLSFTLGNPSEKTEAQADLRTEEVQQAKPEAAETETGAAEPATESNAE